MLNFEAIKLYQEGYDQLGLRNQHIHSALQGFIKSIAQGYSSEHRSPFLLQDSLRLLSLIFQYGGIEEFAEEFRRNYQLIDLRV